MNRVLHPGPDVPILVDGIGERTGLDFDGCHRSRMIASVQQLYIESGATGPAEFLRRLDTDAEEHDRVTDRLTVGETYFMREPAHFELLQTTIAAERLGARPGPLRVWSAGCASGEEPYSVAIAMDDVGLLDQVCITGSDLSEQALTRARSARYSRWSLRRCDAEQRERWFDGGPPFQLKSRFRQAVKWHRAGLLDPPPVWAADVVLCRNVLIYLTPDAVRSATATLHDALAPGGWLLTGASDPPLDHPGLIRHVSDHGVVYRRLAHRPPAPAHQRQRRTVGTSPGVAAGTSTTRRHPPLARTPPTSQKAVGVRGEAAPSHEVRATLGGLAREDSALDAGARCLAAIEHLAAGRPGDALREAGAAIYLEPTTVAPHLVLAHAAERTGDVNACIRGYRNALALLVEQPVDAIVPLLDEPVELLVRGVRERLGDLDGAR